MGKPAARLGDMHTCPMVTPGVPPTPHVGGPIIGPGCPTVLIGSLPAARVGDMAACVGPPDAIVMGSTGVFIGSRPAARVGDMTAHGGVITMGLPTVLIGESGAATLEQYRAMSATTYEQLLRDNLTDKTIIPWVMDNWKLELVEFDYQDFIKLPPVSRESRP